MIDIFILSIFLLGIFLLVSYGITAKALEQQSVSISSSVSRANQGLFAMGMIFIVSSISFALCKAKCKGGDLGGKDMSPSWFLGFFLVLGIVMLSLSATLINGGVGSAKGLAVTNLLIGIGLILACAGGLYLEQKKKHHA